MYAVRAILAADKLDASSPRGLFVVFNMGYIVWHLIFERYRRVNDMFFVLTFIAN